MGWFERMKRWMSGEGEVTSVEVPQTGSSADVPAILVPSAGGALSLEARAPALHERGLARGEEHRCAHCNGPLDPVLFTTWGGPVWADRPMALDGWSCRDCGNLSGPAWLRPEEVAALEAAGGRAGQAGNLDEAELCFRRILSSWVGYPTASMNLASVYMDRMRQPDLPPETLDRYRRVVEAEMRRAAQGDPVPHPFVFQTLARVCAHRGDEAEAREFLARLRADERTPPEMRQEAVALERYLDGLGWLYERGTERIQAHAFAPGTPSDAAVADLRRGIEELERFAERHPDHWQCRFFLGKAHERLGELDRAIRWLEAADAAEHHNPDVGRELAGLFLQAGRAEDAVVASRTALGLSPEDPGLHANLALALLIEGDDEGAGEAIARAMALDSEDPITRKLEALVVAVAAGERERPEQLGPGGSLPE